MTMARRSPAGLILALLLLYTTSSMTEEVQRTFATGTHCNKPIATCNGIEKPFILKQEIITSKLLCALKEALPKTPFSILEKTASLLMSNPSNVGNFALNEIFPLAIHYGLKKILEEPQEEKNENLFKYFDRILDEQEELEKATDSLQQDILKLSLSATYVSSEIEIKNSLSLLCQHLDKPSDQHLRDEFYKSAVDIPKHVRNILDGLLGRHTLSENILDALRDINQCHGRKLDEKVFTLMTIVLNGVDVYKQFLRMKNPNQNAETFSTSIFAKTVNQSVDEVAKRLKNMVQECRMDERAVENEMRDIINQNSNESDEDLTNILFDFLEDKYDTKKWLVITLLDEHRKSGFLETMQTGGFHTVSAKGVFVLAVSNGGNNVNKTLNDANDETLLSPNQRSYLEEFKIPYNLEIYRDSYFNAKRSMSSSDVKVIHDYLGRYLTPLRTDERFDVEFLVYNYEDCQRKVRPSYGNNIYSRGLEHFFLTHTSCPGDSTLPTYRTTKVIVIPKRSWNSTLAVPQHRTDNLKCFPSSNTELVLRNAFSQSYLSAGDFHRSSTRPNGLSLYHEWMSNLPVQKWWFIDNTLRNEHGQCLTVAYEQIGGLGPYIVSRDCSDYDWSWPSQMWIRHGLQIVQLDKKFYAHCLGVEKMPNYVEFIITECSTNPRYLWYHWDTDCEDEMVVHGVQGNSSGRPLRNEFSRQFLDAQADVVKVGPWMNLPGQRWRFVDDQLMNDDGVCLIISHGWLRFYIDKKHCSEAKMTLKYDKWEYNETSHQVVLSNGAYKYCLTSDVVHSWYGYILYIFKQITSGFVRIFYDNSPIRTFWRTIMPPIAVLIEIFNGDFVEGVHVDYCKDDASDQRWFLL